MENFNKSNLSIREESESQNSEFFESSDLLDKQMDYIRSELEYNQQKTGYYENLRYFRILAGDHGSVLYRLGGHWSSFRRYDEELSNLLEKDCSKQDDSVSATTQEALTYLGKTTAGVASKLGLFLWLEDRDANNYDNEALQMIHSATRNKLASASKFDYKSQIGQKFEDTYAGFRIAHMHEIIRTTPDRDLYNSRNMLVRLSEDAAVHSLRIWQTYVQYLKSLGIVAAMPKPSLLNGQMETRKAESTEISE